MIDSSSTQDWFVENKSKKHYNIVLYVEGEHGQRSNT